MGHDGVSRWVASGLSSTGGHLSVSPRTGEALDVGQVVPCVESSVSCEGERGGGRVRPSGRCGPRPRPAAVVEKPPGSTASPAGCRRVVVCLPGTRALLCHLPLNNRFSRVAEGLSCPCASVSHVTAWASGRCLPLTTVIGPGRHT